MSSTSDAPSIRDAVLADADAIARIYNHYVLQTVVSFEEEPVTVVDMAARIEEVASVALPWLVAEQAGQLIGYAYATKWKGRSAYRYSVETSVYLLPGYIGRGLGTALYQRLIDRLKGRGLHVAIGGIALPNDASVALHEKLGFRKVAQFPEVGFKLGRRVDVGYWHLTL